ncbi:MAG: hypothetical protein K2W96_10055 [Gemmataceae bacterium]|nr:hypothetical protein [Gemmataceae bacterium]
MKTISNRIQYHIRSRLAVRKASSAFVLPQALELAEAGYALKASVGASSEYGLAPAGPPRRPARKKRKPSDGKDQP